MKVKGFKKRYIAMAVFLLVLLYITVNAVSIWNYSKVDETKKADVVIVLGAAASDEGVSPVFRERINHAIRLYQEGYVDKIIITGGYGEGNQYSDAYIGKQYAINNGIVEEVILIEEESSITEENLEHAKEIMDNNGYQSALIVSDPLHMKRAMLQAEDRGIHAFSSPTTTSMYRSNWEKSKFLARETFFYIGYKIVRVTR